MIGLPSRDNPAHRARLDCQTQYIVHTKEGKFFGLCQSEICLGSLAGFVLRLSGYRPRLVCQDKSQGTTYLPPDEQKRNLGVDQIYRIKMKCSKST